MKTGLGQEQSPVPHLEEESLEKVKKFASIHFIHLCDVIALSMTLMTLELTIVCCLALDINILHGFSYVNVLPVSQAWPV